MTHTTICGAPSVRVEDFDSLLARVEKLEKEMELLRSSTPTKPKTYYTNKGKEVSPESLPHRFNLLDFHHGGGY